MSRVVQQANKDTYTGTDPGGWQTGRHTGIRRFLLNSYTTVTPATHLDVE